MPRTTKMAEKAIAKLAAHRDKHWAKKNETA
jgi:hypothetical protein